MFKKNFLDNIPDHFQEEMIEVLINSDIIRVERIISDNHSSPENFWYDQDENEFIMVLQGSGNLKFEDGTDITLKRNDYLIIPAHKKHRVEKTSDSEKTIWLAIFYK